MLLTFESVIDNETAETWKNILLNTQWQEGSASAGTLARNVKSNLQLDDANPLAKEFGNEILQRLAQHPEFISAALPQYIFPPKFNCYEKGGHYGLHVDGAIMSLPNQSTMRTDISATLFLTDPSCYEGGELVIETQYGAQEVKLNKGDMVIYPSTSLHQVMPVTKGKRISSFFWVQSMVRDAVNREMLFDLDQSIQVLTHERGSGDEEVKRLNSLYHNLIRRWAL